MFSGRTIHQSAVPTSAFAGPGEGELWARPDAQNLMLKGGFGRSFVSLNAAF